MNTAVAAVHPVKTPEPVAFQTATGRTAAAVRDAAETRLNPQTNRIKTTPPMKTFFLKEEELLSFFILVQQIQAILHHDPDLFLRARFGITADKRFGARWPEENPIILG